MGEGGGSFLPSRAQQPSGPDPPSPLLATAHHPTRRHSASLSTDPHLTHKKAMGSFSRHQREEWSSTLRHRGRHAAWARCSLNLAFPGATTGHCPATARAGQPAAMCVSVSHLRASNAALAPYRPR